MYSEKQKQSDRWQRLDNVANLFPVITSKKQPNVYRVSLNLSDNVEPALLQNALDRTLKWFPAFRTLLRHGVFWYYLEENGARQIVAEEDDYPCRSFPPHSNNNFLFRVTYFATRINLEVFHSITDGTGALQFLKALTCQYLLLAHPEAFDEKQKNQRWAAEHADNTEDSYEENYLQTKKSGYFGQVAFRLRGSRDFLGHIGVVHIHIGTEQLLALCRDKGVSITQYLAARFAYSIYNKQLRKKPSTKPVNFLVPVNLRGIFGSTTALNFFSPVTISLVMSDPDLQFEDVLQEVTRQFAEKISPEKMREKISFAVGSARNIFVRAVPLPVKNLMLKYMFTRSAKSSTLTFTNIGEVKIAEPFRRYITGASALLSPGRREPLKCTICSCKGQVTISFSSILHSSAIQMDFAGALLKDGLSVVYDSNREGVAQ